VELTQTLVNAAVIAIVGLIVTRMLQGQRQELRADAASVRSEIGALRQEFREEVGDVRRDIREVRSDLTRIALALRAEPRTSRD